MNLVEQFQRELATRLPYAKWVTIGSNPNAPEGKKGGTPVQIGDGGKITKGPSGLKGKKIGSVDKGKPEAKKTDKPKAKPRAPKLSIQQASNELADRGYRLIPKPVRQDLKAGKTWYAVVSPDGTTKAMTGQEIAQFVADQRQQETDLKARMVNQVMEALGRKERYSRSPLAEMFQREFDRRLNYARKFREEDHPRGQPDNAGQFVEKPGGKKATTKGKGKPKAKSSTAGKATKKKAVSERSARAKASHKLVAKDVQRYAEEHNEPRFAKTMKGRSLPNGEPVDVVLPNPDSPTHGIELKTMVDNGNNKLTMDSYSQVRKILWEKETGATVHTIVIDDRNVYSPDGNHKPESNRKYYYRRGVAGSARIESLHEVKSIKELRRLMDMDEADLPPKAQRTDAKLRVGKWRPIRDGNKKGFQNTKTGKVFMAKK